MPVGFPGHSCLFCVFWCSSLPGVFQHQSLVRMLTNVEKLTYTTALEPANTLLKACEAMPSMSNADMPYSKMYKVELRDGQYQTDLGAHRPHGQEWTRHARGDAGWPKRSRRVSRTGTRLLAREVTP